jgi:hypothetical protein
MKKLLRLGVIAVAVCLGLCRAASADDEGKACGLRTLHGRYIFAATGFTVVAVGGVAQSQPKAIVEVLDFDGDGTVTVIAATRSVNGVPVRIAPSVWTYTLDADCSGAIAFDGPAFDLFAEPSGGRLWMIQTNPGSVFQGAATRVSRRIR